MTANGVPDIDVTVTQEHLQDDLFKIYSQLFKDIKREEVCFEELQGGYVNSIFLLSLKTDKNKSLIFRTFNFKFNTEAFAKEFAAIKIDQPEGAQQANPPKDFSEAIFNRITEYMVMNEISKHGLCKKVYAKYNNGIVYGFTTGVVLNGPLMLTYDFMNEAASKLAKFHSIKYDIPSIPFKTHHDRVFMQLGPHFQGMMMAIDKEIEKIDEYPYNEFPRIQTLFEQEEKFFRLLTELGFGTIGFCHNDSNQKNIIWNPQERSLGFIDFEMTMNNYVIFELGYLFGCFPGHFLYDFDESFFPNDDYRFKFLRKYLEEYNRLNGIKKTSEEFETDLEDLFVKVNLTTCQFLLRLSMTGPLFDWKPEFFKNEDLKKRRDETKYFCCKYSIKIWHLFTKLAPGFLKTAEEHLEKKRKLAEKTAA